MSRTNLEEMLRDFYAYIQGEKKNPYSYEHEYTLQKVLVSLIDGAKRG